MIRAVLFDVGGVLAKLDEDELIAEWGPRLGLDIEGVYDAMYRGNDDSALIGAVSAPDWWVVIGERLKLDQEGTAEFQRSLGRSWRWNEELIEFARALRPAYRTAIISNAWSDLRALVTERGYWDLVDEFVCSAEVGCAKPGHEDLSAHLRQPPSAAV